MFVFTTSTYRANDNRTTGQPAGRFLKFRRSILSPPRPLLRRIARFRCREPYAHETRTNRYYAPLATSRCKHSPLRRLARVTLVKRVLHISCRLKMHARRSLFVTRDVLDAEKHKVQRFCENVNWFFFYFNCFNIFFKGIYSLQYFRSVIRDSRLIFMYFMALFVPRKML